MNLLVQLKIAVAGSDAEVSRPYYHRDQTYRLVLSLVSRLNVWTRSQGQNAGLDFDLEATMSVSALVRRHRDRRRGIESSRAK